MATEAQRSLLLRRVVGQAAAAGPRPLGPLRRLRGCARATVAELESALLEPGELEGELGELYAAYRAELDRLGLWDRELERRHAAERVGGDLDAWSRRPVFAYGFEDLTGAEWALLEALAARAEVTVSLPYEPGRDAFASLSRTADDLTALADGPSRSCRRLAGRARPRSPISSARSSRPAARRRAAARRRRPLPRGRGPARDARARRRGAARAAARRHRRPTEIAIVCPSLDRWRAPLDTAFTTLGVPYALEGRLRLGQTPFGQALLALLRYAWLDGDRRDLFAFLRSPYSGLARPHVDFLEGRLRGRGVSRARACEEEAAKLRGQPLPHLDALRDAADAARRRSASSRARCSRAAYGLEAPPTGEPRAARPAGSRGGR